MADIRKTSGLGLQKKGTQVKNRSKHAVADKRREIVARGLLRGMTQLEIANYLAEKGMVGKKGKPYSPATISRDVSVIRGEWRLAAARDYQDHIAAALAEIRELRRHAWKEMDTRLILKCWDREVKLLGLNAPEIMQIIDWRREAIEVGLDVGDLFDSMVRTATSLIEDRAGPVIEGSVSRS